MTEKFKGLVIDITRHSDRHDIITLFTRSRGRISFLSPASRGKAGKLRQSRLLPLAAIEGDFNFRQNASLQRLGQFSMTTVWHDIYFNPMKQLVVMFLSEFLNRLLQTTMPDENLWDYTFNSIFLFDSMDKGANDFHIVFLASLLPFAGIQPDLSSYRPGHYLDMNSGIFTDRPSFGRECLNPEEAEFATKLLRFNFSNIRALRLNAGLRSRILSGLLKYYGIHYPGTGNLKSLSVIHDILH